MEKYGIERVSSGADSIYIPLDLVGHKVNFLVSVNLVNNGDTLPSVYNFVISNTTTSGFYVNFSGEIDSDNYYVHWRVSVF